MQKTRNRRKYELRRRAESQAETRRRIVTAIVALHEEVGPAKTTVSAVAERAGVERLTVYRHFPDEYAQFAACSAHWSAEHPLPELERWAEVSDPEQRLRRGLRELYDFYRHGEPMLCNILKDAPQLPDLQRVMEPFGGYLRAAVQTLLAGWPVAEDARPMLAAAVGHAVQFESWRSLVRGQGLRDEAAVELMVRLVVGAGSPTRWRPGL